MWNPEDFVPVEGEPNQYRAPDGAIYCTREDQSLEEFLIAILAEAEAPASSGDLIAFLADLRWQSEISGTTWNGWNLPTDDRSQAKYLAEFVAVEAQIRLDGDYWKFDHGFESLTNAQVVDMATAARQWILSCFMAEAQIQIMMSQGLITTTDEIVAQFPLLLA